MKYRIRQTVSGPTYYLEQSQSDKDEWEIIPCSPQLRSLVDARLWLHSMTTVKLPDIIHPYP